MTISTTVSKILYAPVTSTTGPFTFNFPILANTELRVIRRSAAGVDTLLTLTTNYTVSAGPWANGGTVTTVVAINGVAGEKLLIKLDIAATQGADIPVAGIFPADDVEGGLDRSVRLIQQLEETIDRCLQLQESTGLTPALVPDPPSGGLLLWNGTTFNWALPSALSPSTVLTTAFSQTLIDDATASEALSTLGVTAYVKTILDDASAAAALTTLGVSAYMQGLLDDATAAALFASTGMAPGVNALINGSCQVAQRGTSFTSTTTPANSDDTYLLDQIILLSDGADIFDVTQETAVARLHAGAYAGVTLDVETANLKGGILWLLDAKRTAALWKNATGTVSLAFSASMPVGTTQTLIRAAVIAWNGTADAVTSDIVSAWGAEGTNPTLVASWAFENTPAALAALTSAVQRFTIENIALDTASTKNLGVFIWCEDKTNTVGDMVTISAVKLEPGAVATPYVQPSYGDELYASQNFLQRWDRNATNDNLASGYQSATTAAQFTFPLFRPMRAAPTMTVSNVAHFIVQPTSLDTTDLTAVTTINGARMVATFTGGPGGTPGATLQFDATAGAFLQMSAEL